MHEFLSRHDQGDWNRILDQLRPAIHEVDRDATSIWFAIWPLKLNQSLVAAEDPAQVIRQFELDGRYRLDTQIDASVHFLFGALFWPQVKNAILERTRQWTQDDAAGGLENEITGTAESLARTLQTEGSLLLGITAVGYMVLQQVGGERLQESASSSAAPVKNRPRPEVVIRQRTRRSKRGLRELLRTIDKRYRVCFDESRRQAAFELIHGQDISMAAAGDRRDYQSRDPRCDEGPIPFQCRTAACGSCWIGLLSGRENLIEISDFEKQRLFYFGYLSRDREIERHPPIRLACQARCYGDVTIVIPPWNGVLDGRR